MKIQLFALALFLLAVTACSNAGPGSENSDSPKYDCIIPPPDSIPVTHAPDTIQECYYYDSGEEHDWMKMMRVNDSAYGELHYTWEGKDGSNGTFHGKFSGDTLRIVFDSFDEGRKCQSERIYLRSNNRLSEGQVDLHSDESGETWHYTITKLRGFSKTEYLEKTNCR